MQSRVLFNKIITGVLAFLMMSVVQADSLWSFTPLTSTSITVPASGTGTIQYRVTNQSGTYHILTMTPINGISQVTAPGNCPVVFALADNEWCLLTLTITGSQLTGNVKGGPEVCQQGSRLQCYQPEEANILNITQGEAEYTVGGSVFGLLGSVVLQNNGGDAITMNADGSFTFSNPLPPGSTYSVTVQSQPATQTCSVSQGNGSITNSNVTNVVVNCSTNAHTVGGNISGLSGTVVLQNNGGDNLILNANGSYNFPTPVAQGANYVVTVLTQPATQTCSVSNGSGIMGNTDVVNVHVTCSTHTFTVGGNVSGLSGTVVLQNNGADTLPINADGLYTFPIPVAQGAPYAVTILSQPATQTCVLSNQNGIMGGANVTNVGVACTTNTTTLTTSVSDLALSVNDPGTNTALTGNPRIITITNTGSFTATGLSIVYPIWPTGTTALSTCGATLAASATCTITIIPGANATSTCPNGIAPTPGAVTVNSSNASSVTTNVLVLSYNCVYQGGYLFSVDDTTANTVSIGGKVVSTTDQAARYPGGIVWSTDAVSIFGISETSTTVSPDPASGQVSGQSACNGTIDGACDTNNIYVYYQFNAAGAPVSTSSYAAGLCKATINTYSDWYLPAICEMGPDDFHTPIAGCAAGTQNIIANLPSLLGDPNSSPDTSCTLGVNCLSGYYVASTELASDPQNQAWHQYFSSGGDSYHLPDYKYLLIGVRCIRALTP